VARVTEAVLAVFDRRHAPALFVTELAHDLHTPPDSADLANDLEALERRGSILVAEHPVPDPHLQGIDLRIVAPLPGNLPHAEAEAAAAHAAELLWNKWLASLLSSHRCQ
jgi:hypothetical protein